MSSAPARLAAAAPTRARACGVTISSAAQARALLAATLAPSSAKSPKTPPNSETSANIRQLANFGLMRPKKTNAPRIAVALGPDGRPQQPKQHTFQA